MICRCVSVFLRAAGCSYHFQKPIYNYNIIYTSGDQSYVHINLVWPPVHTTPVLWWYRCIIGSQAISGHYGLSDLPHVYQPVVRVRLCTRSKFSSVSIRFSSMKFIRLLGGPQGSFPRTPLSFASTVVYPPLLLRHLELLHNALHRYAGTRGDRGRL